jgi:hypothetical protein
VLNPALKGMFAIPLAAEGPDSPSMPVTCYLDGKLVESCHPNQVQRCRRRQTAAPFDPVNLNLVLDVELSMSLRFGQCASCRSGSAWNW